MKAPDASAVARVDEHISSLDPSGKPPAERLKDARSSHAIYRKARVNDRESAWNRRLVDDMYDGAPPRNPALLVALGQSHNFNLNFGEASAKLDDSMTSYSDLADSVNTLIRVALPPSYKSESERTEKQEIIAAEHYRMQREWNQFDFNLQLVAKAFVKHGVGVAFWENELDWRHKVAGLGDFLIPRGTPANEESIEIAFCTRKYQAHQLYKFIMDQERAASQGWNVPTTIKAIVIATYGNSPHHDWGNKWEEFQVEVKNNDLFIGQAKASTISVNHVWVQEFSGKISHYMQVENDEPDDFLFCAPSRFDNANQCYVTYTFGVGNGFYHGIRGQGYKILPHIQALNRIRNAQLDAAFLELSLLVDTADADDLTTLSLVTLGQVTCLPPGLRIQEHQFANKSAEVSPVIQELSLLIEAHTGQYQQSGVDQSVQGRDRVTGVEIKTANANRNTLSVSAMNLFYLPWRRQHRETFRRMQNTRYQQNDPGGREIFEFRRRCLMQGVTMEDIAAVHDVDVVRAVGNGSQAMRAQSLDQMMQYVGALDEVGRNNLMRDMFAQHVGHAQVDRYLPRIATPRPVLDERLAELENADFRMGQSVPVSEADQHAVHVQAHLQSMQQTAQALQQQQIEPKEAFTHLQVAVPHTKQHLAQVSQDISRGNAYKKWATDLNAMENLGKQLANNLQAEMEAQLKQMQDQQAQNQQNGQADPKLQQQIQMHQAQMQMLMDKHNLTMRLRAEDASQRMQLRNIQEAAKLQASIPKNA